MAQEALKLKEEQERLKLQQKEEWDRNLQIQTEQLKKAMQEQIQHLQEEETLERMRQSPSSDALTVSAPNRIHCCLCLNTVI